MQLNMKFQPDMTSRSKVNWSLKLDVQADFPRLGSFYEAKMAQL